MRMKPKALASTYRLMNKEGLRVKTGLLKDGEKEVRDDNAEAMIVIGKGFEANLKAVILMDWLPCKSPSILCQTY